MEENNKLLESLLEKATEFGKTSLELAKLKTIDKTTDVVSSVVPHSAVVIMISSFMLFLNLGIAFWLGEVFGKIFYGFFAVAAFYIIVGLIVQIFMHEWIKKLIYNYLIKQLLK